MEIYFMAPGALCTVYGVVHSSKGIETMLIALHNDFNICMLHALQVFCNLNTAIYINIFFHSTVNKMLWQKI